MKDADAEAALGEGWGDSPGGPSGLQDADPFQWFDTWPSNVYALMPEAGLKQAWPMHTRTSLRAVPTLIPEFGRPRCESFSAYLLGSRRLDGASFGQTQKALVFAVSDVVVYIVAAFTPHTMAGTKRTARGSLALDVGESMARNGMSCWQRPVIQHAGCTSPHFF